MKGIAQGASALIQYKDDSAQDEPFWVYLSFGEYDEDLESGVDSLGQADDLIFFYTTEEELLAGKFSEFEVLEYQIEREALYYAA